MTGAETAFAAPLILLAALLLDRVFGEPEAIWSRIPHPAALMGAAVGLAERRLNRGGARRLKGALALGLLVALAGAAGWLITLAGPLASALAAAVLFAQKSLVDHVRAVSAGLSVSLEAGRRAVGMIVGRDTSVLDEAGVARAAIESAAENFSDGLAAPVFWFVVGGPVGLIIYKMVNTADSMIGHRTERYAAFGWAAARLDDVMNLAPARLSAGLIALASRRPRRALAAAWRDARKHASPNAGWPEAATAGALGLSLGGPRRYGTTLLDAPELNAGARRDAGPDDIAASVSLIDRAWVIIAAAAGASALASLLL